ncbi:MAG: excinuclease ABC subunit UvrB [Planctomycetota bacterium]|nr:excinuclease ABC subunit UvrB [Planctomycetota bacterium]
MGLRIDSPFELKGDQPEAVARLTAGLRQRVSDQTLLGVTGSGKTFTMAHVMAESGRPALVLSHNKTLAAQLFEEFRRLLPDIAVEYFVSYYDYYQPEAYIASSDTYIEKDATINDRIDRMRHRATFSVLTRPDVVVVASVSCIFGLGSPESYHDLHVHLARGQTLDRDELLRRLAINLYRRAEMDFRRGTFRVRGDVVDIFPIYADDRVIRVELFGDTVEALTAVDPLRGEILEDLETADIYPGSHYVTPREKLMGACEAIEEELDERLHYFRRRKQAVEAQRLEQRTRYDLELLREVGTCAGIENYSRHLDGRREGEAPWTLLDYFPKDFVLFVDESHVALPQVGGMYRGDRARKLSLVEHGFRLPSALDNRPLRFEEFQERVSQVLYISATPADYELQRSRGHVVEQIVRPTGLVDPQVEQRPVAGQVDDLLAEIRTRAAAQERVLVTTLTKRMAEELTEYYTGVGVKCRYLHSDIDTLERTEIIRDLRLGKFDVLIGINLLREGLDLPEVSLVAILDADKEGFLRDARSLIQTIGRASRNINGRVLLYADRETGSIRRAVSETDRRRKKQLAYNAQHGITPETVRKEIGELIGTIYEQDYPDIPDVREPGPRAAQLTPAQLRREIEQVRTRMFAAAADLRFEEAAELRDRLREFEARELGLKQ